MKVYLVKKEFTNSSGDSEEFLGAFTAYHDASAKVYECMSLLIQRSCIRLRVEHTHPMVWQIDDLHVCSDCIKQTFVYTIVSTEI